MIVGHHLLWTAYGWWLPNDPRGSMSRQIGIQPLARLGERHYGRKETQPTWREVQEFYEGAKEVLKHELLTFDRGDVEMIAGAFCETMNRRHYTCYACAIMPDHVHVLIRKHRDSAEDMIASLQESSREALIANGRRDEDHPVWGGSGWRVFQFRSGHVRTTINYIEQNPVKIGRPVQHWDFVTDYDGWVPGRHSERAAYDLRIDKS